MTKDVRGTVLTFLCVEGPASADGGDIVGATSPLVLLEPDRADPPLFSRVCGA
jgi:hypothetical protein